jgi:hypothetical protein
MFKKGPIPVLVHGLIEYVAAVLLIVAPFAFAFESDVATGISVGAGIVVLVVTASTAIPTGLVKSIPVQAHVILDYVLALFLIASPFLFSFDDDAATVLFLLLGILHLVLTIATRFIGDEARS